MYLAKVRGTVVSTMKAPSLTGCKLLVIEKLNEDLTSKGTTEVAVDAVGAGDGEIVLVSRGSSARYIFSDKGSPIDAAIVGIVDTVEVTSSR